MIMRLVGLESGWYVRVERHVNLRILVSVRQPYTNPNRPNGLVQSGHHHIVCNVFSPWHSRKITDVAFSNNHSLNHSIYYTITSIVELWCPTFTEEYNLVFHNKYVEINFSDTTHFWNNLMSWQKTIKHYW
jgi:hypothetical protein